MPDDANRRLKVRTGRAGTSPSEYVRAELELVAPRPTPRELRARLETRERVEVSEPAAELIRRRRDA